MEEQEGKTWNVCGWSYKRTEELWGRTSKTEIKKITCEPRVSFLLVATLSYTLHDGYFFLLGVSLTVPCCFTWGVSLSLTHPELVYVGSTSCAPPCWFIWGVTLACPALVYVQSFSYTPHAGFFLLGISLIRSMLASLCREFLLYKTKRKNVKVNKNVHNWVMLLLFKAEADIQYRLHKVASCLPADSAEINTNMKWIPVKQ